MTKPSVSLTADGITLEFIYTAPEACLINTSDVVVFLRPKNNPAAAVGNLTTAAAFVT